MKTAKIMGTEVQREVLAPLKKSGVGMKSAEIFEQIELEIHRSRVTQALTELMKDGLASCDDNNPRKYFFERDGNFSSTAKRVPYEPIYVYPKNRHERFDWTHETYVPPPPPALRSGAMDFRRCPSVGTP